MRDMTIRLAVVDAHPLTRYGLSSLVAREPDVEVVAECGSAAEAPRAIGLTRAGVVTVDVALPDGDGLRLARDLRDRHADLGIVVLTARGDDDVLFRALETGASAFVAKTAPVTEVLAAIRHAAVAASSFTAAGLGPALARRRAGQDRDLLSTREREVLRLLAEGRSVRGIATETHISLSTAKTYVARVYDKLGASNRAQALVIAMRRGLIRAGAATPAAGVPAVPVTWLPPRPRRPVDGAVGPGAGRAGAAVG